MTAVILSVHRLVTGYGHMKIVHGIDLEVRQGSITALVGGNGAGKTTIMLALAGLLPVFAGQLAFKGTDVTQQRSNQRVESGLALVPEGRKVFPTLTVQENLRLGAIVPRAQRDWQDRMEEMFALFPRLKERHRQLAGTLSGGEQQMLAIARGLMSSPSLLLLDEPTLGLAPIMAGFVFETIQSLNERGVTILLAEQDTRRTLGVAHEAHVIENGRVTLSGAGQELANHPLVRQAYLGL